MTTTQDTSKKWSDLFDKQASAVQGDAHVIATIEIHHEHTPKTNQDDNKTTKRRSSEVHSEAKKVADHLYTTQLEGIIKTTTRSSLERFYEAHVSDETRAKLSELGIGFSEVLFAMAKGMKVVNVFRPEGEDEQRMGWHKPEAKYRLANKESKKRLQRQPDGWVSVGKVPSPEIVASAQVKQVTHIEPTLPVVTAPAQATEHAKLSPIEEVVKLDDDAIIAGIKALKADMENHLCAIESLVPLHDDHADKITIIDCNTCAVAKRVVEYHKQAKADLVILLDTLQMELDDMKARKVYLCEQLKN